MYITTFVRKLNIMSRNYTFAYCLIQGLVCIIAGCVKFYYDRDYFNGKYLMLGFIASFLTTAASLFSQIAITSGAPLGPITALNSTQVLILTLITAVFKGIIPNWMQLLGLAFGLFSACVLTMPDHMLNLWHRITKC